MESPIEILYQDEYLVIVNKPVDLPVHRNDFMPHDAPYLNKLIGQQTGKGVYNVHRIDSKTSGIVMLAFTEEAARRLTLLFEQRMIEKKYLAIVLGIPEQEGEYSQKVLAMKKGKYKKDAQTKFRLLSTVLTEIEHKEYQNAPISLVEISPVTGRWHQIRQHFAQNRHDIIGDSQHGDFGFNKTITALTGLRRLFLHAYSIRFIHPFTENEISIKSKQPEEFMMLMNSFRHEDPQ